MGSTGPWKPSRQGGCPGHTSSLVPTDGVWSLHPLGLTGRLLIHLTRFTGHLLRTDCHRHLGCLLLVVKIIKAPVQPTLTLCCMLHMVLGSLRIWPHLISQKSCRLGYVLFNLPSSLVSTVTLTGIRLSGDGDWEYLFYFPQLGVTKEADPVHPNFKDEGLCGAELAQGVSSPAGLRTRPAPQERPLENQEQSRRESVGPPLTKVPGESDCGLLHLHPHARVVGGCEILQASSYQFSRLQGKLEYGFKSEEDFKSRQAGDLELKVPPSGGSEELPRPYKATRNLLRE